MRLATFNIKHAELGTALGMASCFAPALPLEGGTVVVEL
jgi:hypothetical protein